MTGQIFNIALCKWNKFVNKSGDFKYWPRGMDCGHTGQKLISFYHELPSFKVSFKEQQIDTQKHFLNISWDFVLPFDRRRKLRVRFENKKIQMNLENLLISLWEVNDTPRYFDFTSTQASWRLFPTFPINGSETIIWWVFPLSLISVVSTALCMFPLRAKLILEIFRAIFSLVSTVNAIANPGGRTPIWKGWGCSSSRLGV